MITFLTTTGTLVVSGIISVGVTAGGLGTAFAIHNHKDEWKAKHATKKLARAAKKAQKAGVIEDFEG